MGPDWRHHLRPVAGAVAPTSVLTALMVYFGYVREWAYYGYFGMDLAMPRLSNQSLLLTGVSALYVPVGALFVVGALAAWAHNMILAVVQAERRRRAVRGAAAVVVRLGALR